jgi:AraC-type DNA-binding domain-containing proteins
MANANHIPVVKFHKRKYGEELLIDIVTLETIRRSKHFTGVQRQSFYGIMLTTAGEANVEVDGHPCIAKKGLVACVRPGDVCTVLNDNGLDSLELIFERDFLLSFFNDTHFLDGIAYLSPQRTSPYLWLDDTLYNKIIGLYDSILIELHGSGKKNPHLLRAMLYEVLMLLQKASLSEETVTSENDRVTRFRQLVDKHYLTESGVEFYADKLAVTSNYLNRLVKQNLDQSTKQYIQNRRIDEAKRLLRYTELSVADIAEQLNFETSSYFVRAFSKVTKTTPLKYRASN